MKLLMLCTYMLPLILTLTSEKYFLPCLEVPQVNPVSSNGAYTVFINFYFSSKAVPILETQLTLTKDLFNCDLA